METDALGPGALSKVRRGPDRARYDRSTVYAILDEALYCNVCYLADGVARALPTAFGREGDDLYFHGAAANASLQAMQDAGRACVTVTLLDGVVLARSAFHHSMNYRSVLAFGPSRAVQGDEEKLHALSLVIEHMVPGRWSETRHPTPAELRATRVSCLHIEEASAKVRSGGPVEEPEDLAVTNIWAGHIPLRTVATEPVPDSSGTVPVAVPDQVTVWARSRGWEYH